MVTTTRRRGINASAAIKVPCIAASTANLTLSGEQTVDGIALVDGDRCFAKNQTDTTEIGIYFVSTGPWVRAPDFDGAYDVVEGTIIPVSRGTTNGDTYWKVTNTGAITIGTTALTVSVTTVLSSAILNDGSVRMVADFSPNATDTYDIGTPALKWEDFHFNGDGLIGGTLGVTGAVSMGKGADVASATALPVLTDGNYFDVTGTTTITSINTIGAGTVIRLHFDGILTLTHHATDLILPGGLNITTAAGDEAEFVEYAAGDWRCTNYQSVGSVYSEGTFTPTLQDDSLSDAESQTYTTQDGSYTRIGNRIFFELNISISSLGTLTTSETARIAGLPFTANASAPHSSVNVGRASSLSITSGNSLGGVINEGTTYIQLYVWDISTGSTGLTIAELSTGADVSISGHYRV